MEFSREKIGSELVSLLQTHTDEQVRIGPSTMMCGELGLGSLEMLALVAEIEAHFGVRLPDDELPRLRTVADMLVSIERRLGERGALVE